VLLVFLGVFVLKMNREKRQSRTIGALVELAEKPGATDVKVTSGTLQLLLKSVASTESNAEIQKIGKALTLAKSTDGTDVDERIAAFATKGPELSVRAKEILISEVLRTRNNPAIMPAMLDFAASSDDPALVVAALQAVRQMAGDGQFDRFLKLLESTDNNLIRDATEENIVEILRKTGNLADLTKQLKDAHESNVKPDIQRALQRLLSLAESIKPRAR